MKFSCTQENLHQGLSVVSHIANKNVNLPILGNVLIRAEDSGLKFMATNLEIAVSCTVRGKVEERGEFTVPSKLFSDYVGLLPKERVDVRQEGSGLAVSCGTYQTRMTGIAASEFPLIPTIEHQQSFVIGVNDLRKAVSQVLFAVAPNESRPEISGVLFKFVPEGNGINLILAATDSYRLAERVVPVRKDGSTALSEAVSVIVPARTVSELTRVLGVFKDALEGAETIEIAMDGSQIMFIYQNVELISRTIEGRYPDYRQLIPHQSKTTVSLRREDVIRAVKATSLFSKTGLNDIHLSFTPGAPVRLTANNSQTGEHTVDVEGSIDGVENKVTVNFRYFLDGVNNVESNEFLLELVDGISPCVMRPKGGEDYLYIVMPIRQ